MRKYFKKIRYAMIPGIMLVEFAALGVQPHVPIFNNIIIKGSVDSIDVTDNAAKNEVVSSSSTGFTCGKIDQFNIVHVKYHYEANVSDTLEQYRGCLKEYSILVDIYRAGTSKNIINISPPCSMQVPAWNGSPMALLAEIAGRLEKLPDFEEISDVNGSIVGRQQVNDGQITSALWVFDRDGYITSLCTMGKVPSGDKVTTLSEITFSKYDQTAKIPTIVELKVSREGVTHKTRISINNIRRTVHLDDLVNILPDVKGMRYKDSRFEPPVFINKLETTHLPNDEFLMQLAEKTLQQYNKNKEYIVSKKKRSLVGLILIPIIFGVATVFYLKRKSQ